MGLRYREDRKAWELSFYVNGKRLRKMFETEQDARRFETSSKVEVTGSQVKILIRKYVEVFTARKSKEAGDKYHFTLLYEFLKRNSLSELNQIHLEHLQQFQTELLLKPLKPQSVNRMFNTYKHFFGACVDWRLIQASPAARLKKLPEPRGVVGRPIWTDQDITRVLAAAEGWMRDFITVVAFTGMRPVEVTRLRWETDVDLKSNRLLAVSFKGQGDKRERWLPMPQELAVVLKERRLREQGGLVFSNSRGGPMDTAIVARAFTKLAARCGLKGYGLYGMRHSFATRALEAGVDLNALRLLLGHSSLNTTQVYLRYAEGHLVNAVSLLNDKRKELVAPHCHQTATNLSLILAK